MQKLWYLILYKYLREFFKWFAPRKNGWSTSEKTVRHDLCHIPIFWSFGGYSVVQQTISPKMLDLRPIGLFTKFIAPTVHKSDIYFTTTELSKSNCWTVGLLQIYKSENSLVIFIQFGSRLVSCQTVKLPDLWTIGLMHCQTFELVLFRSNVPNCWSTKQSD